MTEISKVASDELLVKLQEIAEKGDNKIAAQNISKIITAWIDLQNAVNCYMDSAKDINLLNRDNGPAGRQYRPPCILEIV